MKVPNLPFPSIPEIGSNISKKGIARNLIKEAADEILKKYKKGPSAEEIAWQNKIKGMIEKGAKKTLENYNKAKEQGLSARELAKKAEREKRRLENKAFADRLVKKILGN